MNDAEYLFKQQEINTKRIARGAFSKKRGGGKHCRLPLGQPDKVTEK